MAEDWPQMTPCCRLPTTLPSAVKDELPVVLSVESHGLAQQGECKSGVPSTELQDQRDLHSYLTFDVGPLYVDPGVYFVSDSAVLHVPVDGPTDRNTRPRLRPNDP